MEINVEETQNTTNTIHMTPEGKSAYKRDSLHIIAKPWNQPV
jgi:hypothetical protein